MKKTTIIIMIFMLIVINYSKIYSQDKKPVIAVMDIDAKGEKVSKDDAHTIADFLRTDLANTGTFSVVERSRMKDVLKEQEFSSSGLTETEKATRAGKLLNCDFIIAGTLSSLGDKFFLNVRVVNVKTGETTLGKRDSSKDMEELSNISKKIANELSSLEKSPEKQVSKGIKNKDIKEKKFKSPPFGFDIQFNLSKNLLLKDHSNYNETDIYPSSSLTARKKIDTKCNIALSDLRVGLYYNKLYFGFIHKSFVIETGTEITINRLINNIHSPEVKNISTGEYKLNSDDLIIGVRSWTKGDIDPKILYLAWRKVKEKYTSPNKENQFQGPGIGILTRNTSGKGAVQLLFNFGLHFSYLGYKKPDGFNGDMYGLLGGGEIGIGAQLRKIGIFMILTYTQDAFYVNYDYKETKYDSQNTAYTHSMDGAAIEQFSGFELRLGYTFDMQALFN